MIKIRVSYERPEELQRIKKLLHGHVKPWKESSAPDGTDGSRFRKAYTVMKEGK